MTYLIRIKAPHFVAGIIPHSIFSKRKETVAPIIKYMKKWSVIDIIKYCNKKNWEYKLFAKEKLK